MQQLGATHTTVGILLVTYFSLICMRTEYFLIKPKSLTNLTPCFDENNMDNPQI